MYLSRAHRLTYLTTLASCLASFHFFKNTISIFNCCGKIYEFEKMFTFQHALEFGLYMLCSICNLLACHALGSKNTHKCKVLRVNVQQLISQLDYGITLFTLISVWKYTENYTEHWNQKISTESGKITLISV